VAEPSTDRVFDNADSFAQVFDQTWRRHEHSHPGTNLSSAEKLDLIFDQVRDHPFCLSQPAVARQVAAFRVRLLNL
jgi:hypothetical protein